MTNKEQVIEKIADRLKYIDIYYNPSTIQIRSDYIDSAKKLLKEFESLGYVPPDKVIKVVGNEIEYFIEVSALEKWVKSRGYVKKAGDKYYQEHKEE